MTTVKILKSSLLMRFHSWWTSHEIWGELWIVGKKIGYKGQQTSMVLSSKDNFHKISNSTSVNFCTASTFNAELKLLIFKRRFDWKSIQIFSKWKTMYVNPIAKEY